MMKWQRPALGALGARSRWLLPGIILAALVVLFLLFRMVGSWFGAPAPQTIAQASLESMREQQRLTSLTARYVAVVTSTQDRLGGVLQAQKTMIMPGDVRYEINLAALTQDSLRWNGSTNTLSITLPPIEISQPQIDLNAIQEYRNGSVLFAVTSAEDALDTANRAAAQRSLMEQARQPMPMRIARESAKRAIARSFAMPLRAAGVEANVEVRFADEARDVPSYMDGSTPMNEVLGRPVVVDEKK